MTPDERDRLVNEKSPLIKTATNEWTLLGWRVGVAFLSSCVAVMSALALTWLSEIRSSQSAISDKFAAFQLTNEARLGRVEGELGVLKGSVNAHRDRIINVEGGMGTLWQRLYDARTPSQQRNVP